MGNPILTSLSSVGTGRAVALDWRPKTQTSFAVTGSSSGSFACFVEASLDDLQLSSSPVWFTQSSATFVANSSICSLPATPFAAIRLNSTALSSAVLTLRVLQGYSE